MTGQTRRKRYGVELLPEYGVWCAMKRRCYNPKEDSYQFHGARGIRVCDRWRTSFSRFLKDMGRRPTSNHSIERLDNNGDYEPLNCAWRTPKAQARNRRSTLYVTYFGVRKPLAEWAEEFGIKYITLYMRLQRKNFPDLKEVTTEAEYHKAAYR